MIHMSNDLSDLTRDQIERSKHLTLARWLSSLHATKGSPAEAIEAFAARWPLDLHGHVVRTKSPVTPTGGLSPTVTPEALTRAFVASTAPFTVLGRLAPRVVPPHVPAQTSTPPTAFGWRPAGKPLPALALAFSAGDALAPLMFGGIVAVSADLMRLHVPGAEPYMLDELRRGYVAALDDALVNPIHTGTPGEAPASITAGQPSIGSSGTSRADAVADFRSLWSLYVAAGGRAETCVILLSSRNAVALALLGDPFGRLTRDGGTVMGLPVIASDSVGPQVVAVDPSQILMTEGADADITVSTQVAVQMDDDPTQDGLAGTGVSGSSLVSLWQNNLVGVKIQRALNWRVDGGVARVSGATYYEAGSPA